MEPNELKKLIEEINKSFDEFKKKNDQRIAELEKGRDDPLLKEQVDKLAAVVQDNAEMKERLEKAETKLNRPIFDPDPSPAGGESKELKLAINQYLRKGVAIGPEEVKLLAEGGDPTGGYWVEGEVSSVIIKKVFETSPMRPEAFVETISTDALEIPDDLGEASSGWAGETQSRPETNTPTVGVRRIPVHEQYAMPKATQMLLDDARVNVEAWLGGKVSDKFSREENTAFINGNGVDKPRGILTYPAGTTNPGQIQQINSGSAAALKDDGLRKVFYALKSPYIGNAKWYMGRPTIEAISLLKDTQDRYVWQPGLQVGEPQSLLGHPIVRMEDMPAVTANSLSIVFGNMRQGYTIVDRMGVRVLRDPYSSKPFVLFYTTKRVGGDVTNFEAMIIQKTAA